MTIKQFKEHMRIRQLYNLIMLVAVVLAVQAVLPSQVLASYSSQAIVVSTDLLSGSSASSITNFYYNIASLPATSSVRIQFSKDNSSWYSAAGTLDAWTTISATGGANLSLADFVTAASWTSGNSFYYKLELNATSDLAQTPTLEDIRLDYSALAGYEKLFVFDAAGNVGIGTTSPAEALHVVGNIRNSALAGEGNRAVYSDADGMLTNSSSDIRLKTNIETLSDNLDIIEVLGKLRGIYYNWDTSIDAAKNLGHQREIGMSAQEVQAVLPELVGVNAAGYLSLDYSKMSAFLVEVAKVQQKRIDALELHLNDMGLIANASSTDETGDERGFSFAALIRGALAKLGMVLQDGIASLKEVVADRITSKTMCVVGDDGEEVCLTKDQLKELIEKTGSSATMVKTYDTESDDDVSENENNESGGETTRNNENNENDIVPETGENNATSSEEAKI